MNSIRKFLSVILVVAIILSLVPPTTIAVHAATVYTSGDYKYNTNSDGTAYITGYTGEGGDVSIPSSLDGRNVTSIGPSAFSDNTTLTSVVLPETVTAIGSKAFQGCTSLTCIEIPHMVSTIGNDAFSGCVSLESLTIPDSVSAISANLFYGCTGLLDVELPDTILTVGANAFYNCAKLTEITLPELVNFIGASAFNGCTSLISIYIPDSITTIEENAFLNTAYYNDVANWEDKVLYISNALIKAKASFIGEYAIKAGTVCIAEYAFKECTNEFSVTIPDSMSVIGARTFTNSGLSSIVMPDTITAIGSYAFHGCAHLKCTAIPDSVKTIGDRAFKVSGLETISIGSGVEIIDEGAFYECTKLESIYFGDSSISFGDHVFDGCDNLTSVYITDIATWCSHSYYDAKDTIYSYSDYSSSPFYYADNLFLDGCLVTNLVIPDGVERINKLSFFGVNCIESITIPSSIKYIDDAALPSVKSIYIDDLASWCNITFVGASSNPLSGAETLYINGVAVSDLVIPVTVTSISKYAFYNCDLLNTLTLGEQLESIGDYAFQDCDYLENLDLSGVLREIGRYAFCSCDRLTSVQFGNQVQQIGCSAFEATRIETVELPASVQSLQSFSEANSNNHNAFQGCTALRYITVDENNENYTSIDGVLFSKDEKRLCLFPINYGRSSYKIPEQTTVISSFAFYGNADLTSLYIPISVSDIYGEKYYAQQNQIADVWYEGSQSDRNKMDINSEDILYATWHYNSCANEHTYSSNCDITCDLCEWKREPVDAHTYSDDCDVQCNICTFVRETTNAHQYEYACDAVCDMCGYERIITHSYDTDCDTICNVCGHERVIVHAYDNACDTDCNVCGYSQTVHGHVYDNDCDNVCNECGFLRSEREHSYDNACDEQCNACGFLRQTEGHIYDNACDVTCNACGQMREVSSHSYDDDCDDACNVCGATRLIEHVYDSDCDAACNNCGSVRENIMDHLDANSDTVCDLCGQNNILLESILIHANTIKAMPEETVEIVISFDEEQKIKTLGISDIVYDDSVLDLIGGEWLVENAVVSDWNQEQRIGALTFTENTSIGGSFFKLIFMVKAEAPEGDFSVSCTVTAKRMANDFEATVPTNIVAGTVIVQHILPGDLDGNEAVNSNDAVYLLYHTLFPETYPVNQIVDFNGDGSVNSNDVVYLLYYTLFPENYPI